jgi:hypothetical protein
MTERMSTLMPRTSSINGIHTDDMVMAHGVCRTRTRLSLIHTQDPGTSSRFNRFHHQLISYQFTYQFVYLISVYISVCFIPGCPVSFQGIFLCLLISPYQPQSGTAATGGGFPVKLPPDTPPSPWRLEVSLPHRLSDSVLMLFDPPWNRGHGTTRSRTIPG